MLFAVAPAFSQTVVKDREAFAKLSDSLDTYLEPLASIVVRVGVDSAVIDGKNINIHLNKLTSDYYFRDNTVKDIYNIVNTLLPDKYKGMNVTVSANGSTLQELASAVTQLLPASSFLLRTRLSSSTRTAPPLQEVPRS